MRYHALFVIGCVCLLGCTPAPSPSADATAPAATPPPAPGGAPKAAEALTSAIPGASAMPTERVKAEVGVGAKGRSLDGESGMIVTPVKAFFSVQEKLAFEVQLKQAMDIYKATNGSLPKSHDDFMAQVVQANRINLPKLPEGHKYVYDPQLGELQVERPK